MYHLLLSFTVFSEQFKDMAKVLDFSSVDTLAYTIATGTEGTCKDLLHRYYQTKYPSLVVERYLEVSKEEGMVDQRVTEGSKASQKSKIPVKAINAPKPRKRGGKYRRQWKKPEGIGKFNSDNSSSSEDDRQTVGDHTRRKKRSKEISEKTRNEFDKFEKIKESFEGDDQKVTSSANATLIERKPRPSYPLREEAYRNELRIVDANITENEGIMCNTYSSELYTRTTNLSNLVDRSDQSRENNGLNNSDLITRQMKSTPDIDLNLDQDSGKSTSLSFLDEIFF